LIFVFRFNRVSGLRFSTNLGLRFIGWFFRCLLLKNQCMNERELLRYSFFKRKAAVVLTVYIPSRKVGCQVDGQAMSDGSLVGIYCKEMGVSFEQGCESGGYSATAP